MTASQIPVIDYSVRHIVQMWHGAHGFQAMPRPIGHEFLWFAVPSHKSIKDMKNLYSAFGYDVRRYSTLVCALRTNTRLARGNWLFSPAGWWAGLWTKISTDSQWCQRWWPRLGRGSHEERALSIVAKGVSTDSPTISLFSIRIILSHRWVAGGIATKSRSLKASLRPLRNASPIERSTLPEIKQSQRYLTLSRCSTIRSNVIVI